MIDTPETPPVEDLLTQLREPHLLLTDALRRIHAADTVAEDVHDGMDRLTYLLTSAKVLADVAKCAADLADREVRTTMRAIDDGLDQFDADPDFRTVSPRDLAREVSYRPQAMRARFTATVTGSYLGRVGDTLWLYAPGVGYVDASGAWVIESVAVGMTIDVKFAGRVVSATLDHVLCVTDGGTAVTLPRALITESPDE